MRHNQTVEDFMSGDKRLEQSGWDSWTQKFNLQFRGTKITRDTHEGYLRLQTEGPTYTLDHYYVPCIFGVKTPTVVFHPGQAYVFGNPVELTQVVTRTDRQWFHKHPETQVLSWQDDIITSVLMPAFGEDGESLLYQCQGRDEAIANALAFFEGRFEEYARRLQSTRVKRAPSTVAPPLRDKVNGSYLALNLSDIRV